MNPSNSSSPQSFVSSFMNDRNLGNGGRGGYMSWAESTMCVTVSQKRVVSNGVKRRRTVNPLEVHVPYLVRITIGNEMNAHAYEAA